MPLIPVAVGGVIQGEALQLLEQAKAWMVIISILIVSILTIRR
ncbi:hypothetical protein [Paracidovorax sp. MALMAid1276]